MEIKQIRWDVFLKHKLSIYGSITRNDVWQKIA